MPIKRQSHKYVIIPHGFHFLQVYAKYELVIILYDLRITMNLEALDEQPA